MALEKYGFFQGTVEDPREYDSADTATAFYALASNGVANVGDNLEVTAPGGSMSVELDYGRAMILGRYYVLRDDGGGVKVFTHSTEPSLDRIDRIILRLDLTARTIIAAKLVGTANASPVAPALTRTSTVYELSLAQVYIHGGASALVADDITDEREDDTVCGLIAPEGLRPSRVQQMIDDAPLVRYDEQALSDPQKVIARANIDASYSGDHQVKIYAALGWIGVSTTTGTLEEICAALEDNEMVYAQTDPAATTNISPAEARTGVLHVHRRSVVRILIKFYPKTDASIWSNYAYLSGEDWIVGEWQQISPMTEIAATLAAASWVGASAPYTQDLTIAGMTAALKGVSVGLADTATDAQYEACIAAMIRATGQSANKITIRAIGDKPTVDIPVLVRIVATLIS